MLKTLATLETKEGADRAPSLRCEITHETWGPHPGCQEFMAEPDVYPCGGWATVRLVWTEDGIGGVSFNAILLCIDCAVDYVDMVMAPTPYSELICFKLTHIASQTINPEEGK